MRAFLNGEEVFLDGGSLPTIRLTSIDLTDIGKVRGNTSTTINVALTPQSRRALGDQHAARRPRSVTDNVFVITDDGGQEVYRAKCANVSINRDKAEMIAVSGNAYWIDWAKRTKLRDLSLSTSDLVNYNGRMVPVVSDGLSVPSNVGSSLVQESWANNWLIYYPLIDYGALKGSDALFRVAPNAFRPGVRVWKLLEAAFSSGGFTLSANASLRDRLSRLILIDNTDGLRVLVDPDLESMASPTLANGGPGCGLRQNSTGYNLTEYGAATPAPVGGLSVLYDTQSNFNIGTQRFKASEDCGLIMRLRTTKVTFPNDGTFIGKRLRAVFWDDTDNVEFYGNWTSPISAAESAAGSKFISATSSVRPTLKDHFLYFAVQVDDVSGLSTTSVTINQTGVGEQVCVQYVTEADFDTLFASPFVLAVTHRVVVKNILPDITVADLVMDIVSHQGLCMVSNMGGVRLEQLDEFLGRVPTDVSDWIDHTISPKKTHSQLGVVRYRWKGDDSDELLNRIGRIGEAPGYGNADVSVGSGREVREVELRFAATVMDSVLGGKMLPAIRKDGGTPGENNFGISTRLLYDGGLVASPIRVGTANSFSIYPAYPFTYFVRDGDGAPMSFGDAQRHWCPGFAPNTSAGVITALHKREVRNLLGSDILKMYVAWPRHWLKDFDFSRLFSFMDGLAPVNAFVNSIEVASMENKYHLTEFVIVRGVEYAAPANPPVVFPEPPEPVQYRTCAYYQDFTPFPGNTSFYSDAFEVMGFTVNGTNHGDYTFDGVDQYVTVGGMDFFTGLIDALNSMAIPGFTFLPTAHLGTDPQNRAHGGWFTIKAPADAVWSFEVTAYGYPLLRYSNAGIEAWDSGTSAWVPFEYIYGDGPPKGEPRNCTLG